MNEGRELCLRPSFSGAKSNSSGDSASGGGGASSAHAVADRAPRAIRSPKPTWMECRRIRTFLRRSGRSEPASSPGSPKGQVRVDEQKLPVEPGTCYGTKVLRGEETR